MIIGFDMDGVLTDFSWNRWDKLKTKEDVRKYYLTMKPLYDPKEFMHKGDKGVILTFRHIQYRKQTVSWLKKHSIRLPLDMLALDDFAIQAYSDRVKKYREEVKVRAIKKHKVDVYLEDNPEVVAQLRKRCPRTNILQIGNNNIIR